jgi:hypothetical protein
MDSKTLRAELREMWEEAGRSPRKLLALFYREVREGYRAGKKRQRLVRALRDYGDALGRSGR